MRLITLAISLLVGNFVLGEKTTILNNTILNNNKNVTSKYNTTTVDKDIKFTTLNITVTKENSGTIPGTNITLYGLVDPKTGEPMSFDYFLDNLLPGVLLPDGKDISNNITKRDVYDVESYKSWCIPQISTHPLANPYHKNLVGTENLNYLVGAGKPILFPQPGIDCRADAPSPCTLTITQELTLTNTIAYTVSDSTSNTITKNVGGSSSVTEGSSVADTVSHTIEKSWSNSDTHEENYSLAETTGEIVTEGYSDSSNNVTIKNKDTTGSIGINVGGESTESWTENHEKSGNVNGGVNILGILQIGGGGTFTDSDGHTWGSSSSWGLNAQGSQTNSEGSQNSVAREDNYSKQTQDLTTETWGSSDSHTYTEGGSESDTNSRMVTKSVDITASKDWSTSTGTENGSGTSNTSTISTSNTIGMSFGNSVGPGQCRKAVCIPITQMYILPFLCADTEERIAQRVYATISRLDGSKDKVDCFTYGLVDCGEVFTGIPMVTYDTTIREISATNSLRVGDVLDSSNPLVSKNGEYTLTLDTTGNLVIYRGTVKSWESGSTPFAAISGVNTYKHRARISSRGHFVIETANVWSKVKPSYMPNTYVQTWSTQPIFNNFTVGSPRGPMSTVDDYILTLDNYGRLSLYDAAYVKIWCTYDSTTGNSCPNFRGFKYQEEYLLPTDFVTPNPGLGYSKDPHNTLFPDVKLNSSRSYIVSQDSNCTDFILSSTGLVSPNGRFSAILTTMGNFVIKDNTRTMYQSYTANFDGSVGPYHMRLTFEGELSILDSKNRWIWYAPNTVSKTTGPYKASMLDTGKFVITDSVGTEIWETWPQRGLNNAVRLYDKFYACYNPCKECIKDSDTTSTVLLPTITSTTTISTTTTYTAPTTPVVNQDNIKSHCSTMMSTYNVDPFVNWGNIGTDLSLQGEWIWYDCACFASQIKYGIKTFSTAADRWGTLTDTNIQKLYTESSCDCPLCWDAYKILPKPKNWGSLTNTVIQGRWNTAGCDLDINREPYIHNPDNGTPISLTTYSTVSTTTNDVYTTIYDQAATFTTTISGTKYPVITGTPYDYKTVSYVSAKTIAPASPTIPLATPSTTSTTTATALPTCSGGQPGKGTGVGTSGQCCKTDSDCKENCKGGKCGTCGKDFAC